MVGAGALEEVDRLEKEVDEGVGDASKYLALVRKLRLRRSPKVSKHGLSLLNDTRAKAKLGSEVWTVYEQVAIASMDCHRLDVAKNCVEELLKKFPNSMRVGRLEGMWLEAKGLWQQAEKVYASILESHPDDVQAMKRRIAMAKAQGNLTGAIEAMNNYLDTYMADQDCWRELADTYISLQMYKQAAFCYEELILAHPANALFHSMYAEILYTIGGLENLKLAKKYYAAATELSGGKNIRALLGICMCSNAISQTRGRSKDDKDEKELTALAAAVIEKEYKMKAPKKLGLLAGVLKH